MTEPDAAAREIHRSVMERYKQYLLLGEPKVLVACIHKNPAESEKTYDVRQVFATYTSDTSDGPVFAADLGADALRRCEKWAAKRDVDCTCRPLDSNGKNVLNLR